MAKKKKEKIIYYDDNSTISDMYGVSRMDSPRTGKPRPPEKNPDLKRVSEGGKWGTYWASVRMMLIPLLIALGALGVLYLLVMWGTGNLF